jgi:excinuclease UvrABC helicase subunit UvrB
MTEDEMRRLASIIVDKIFERQAELDEEFLNEWQEQIIDQTALNNDQDEIQRLEKLLQKALDDEEYELAAKLHLRIIKLKTK